MRRRHLGRVLAAVAALLTLTSCARVLDGHPVSVFADPFRVGGLEAVDGPTGLRPDAAEPTRDVEHTDGGRVDTLAEQSVSDLEEFWGDNFSDSFAGRFRPVDQLVSWSALDVGGRFCDTGTFKLVNAAYCKLDNTIGWDRGVLLPALREAYGDMAIPMVLAHEYGHAISKLAKLTKKRTPILVAEQQADCFAGVYLRWVAQGDSPRFTLSTGDGLNAVLAAMLVLRDPVLHEEDIEGGGNEHGSAFERISAFQFGFTEGAASCAGIDVKEIDARRGALPVALQRDQTGEWPVSEDSARTIIDAMATVFPLANPPQLSFDADAAESCGNARPSPPASYCPDSNTIAVDLPKLTKMGVPREGDPGSMLSGDNTAYSVLESRYMLAVQADRGGLVLDNAKAALRTACLTGVGTTALSNGVSTGNGHSVALTAGDLDEAVSGLLTNGLAASDINGETVPAGFSRIDAFRTGVLGDVDRCIARFT
ncbi:neutral zinc metallopeptidase [Mycobacterium sp. pUA109]|uniref:neutral zinc metallopeptidase n=1 Tax=Mycobacterium sp. pUA109 TaxID=3238982 RepID=UPI00351BB88C